MSCSRMEKENLPYVDGRLKASEQRVRRAAAKQWLEYEATEVAGYNDEVRIIVGHLASKSPEEVRRWRYMMEADDQAQREGE